MTSFTTLTTVLLLAATNAISAHARALDIRDVTTSSKAGLAWPNGNGENIKQYESGKVSWYYTWSPNCIDIAASLECVPMLWGTDQENAFNSTIESTIDSYSVKAVLAFNEPNEMGQSNLSPEDAASMWKQYLEPLRSSKNVRLGSPAPSSNPDGVTWIQDFLNACEGGCTVDFIALHYYDVNATEFQSYITNYHNLFGKPIWVTEWACQNFNGGAQCSDEAIKEFMNQTESFMDATDFVERYAWFGAFRNLQGVNPDDALMDQNGKITALGDQYIGNQTSSGGGSSAAVALHVSVFTYVLATFVALLVLL
ncbi:glycosyl hydrolase catalytic core-domain-containing protein [Cytidiella melzeri]|nr:glycosyl hydrolase catalytic core-domain-containing protein [Cytidiella melzeri]